MTTENCTDSNWGIMIFKDTFEYLMDGDMSNDEFCELIKCIYNLRENGELPDENKLPKIVRVAWKTLKHSILKSVRNKRYYNNKKQTNDNQVEEETNDNLNNNQQTIDDMGNYVGQIVDGKFVPLENNRTYNKKETVIPSEEKSIYVNPLTKQKIMEYFKPRTVSGTFKTFCSGNSSVYNLGIPLEEIEVVFNEVKTAF